MPYQMTRKLPASHPQGLIEQKHPHQLHACVALAGNQPFKNC